ncbi:MAG: zinc ribbon domain-containing protein [Kiritimatiellia bacterium]
MKIGIWQFLIVTGLILFLFWPVVVKVVRFAARNRRRVEDRRGASPTRSSVFKCPHCGAELANDARFCSRCGRSMDFIDV